MLRFYATDWNEIIRQLDSLSSLLNVKMAAELSEGRTQGILESLRKIERLCHSLGLDFSATYVKKIIETVQDSPSLSDAINAGMVLEGTLRPADFAGQIGILRERIDDELTSREFFTLEPNKTAYLEDPCLFGTAVASSFPSAIADIEEAGKCFVFDRFTACVFHLMRVMEVGLRALGASLNDPSIDPKRNPTWERILGPCDSELRKPNTERSPKWQSNQRFFAEATANLRAVKDAWRNPSLHIEISYDEEKASEVWNAVRGFMRHLATTLHE